MNLCRRVDVKVCPLAQCESPEADRVSVNLSGDVRWGSAFWSCESTLDTHQKRFHMWPRCHEREESNIEDLKIILEETQTS